MDDERLGPFVRNLDHAVAIFPVDAIARGAEVQQSGQRPVPQDGHGRCLRGDRLGRHGRRGARTAARKGRQRRQVDAHRRGRGVGDRGRGVGLGDVQRNGDARGLGDQAREAPQIDLARAANQDMVSPRREVLAPAPPVHGLAEIHRVDVGHGGIARRRVGLGNSGQGVIDRQVRLVIRANRVSRRRAPGQTRGGKQERQAQGAGPLHGSFLSVQTRSTLLPP